MKIKTNFSTISIMVHFQILLILYLTTCKHNDNYQYNTIIHTLISLLLTTLMYDCLCSGISMFFFICYYWDIHNKVSQNSTITFLPLISFVYTSIVKTQQPEDSPTNLLVRVITYSIIYLEIDSLKGLRKSCKEPYLVAIIFCAIYTIFGKTDYGTLHLLYLLILSINN